MPAPLSDDERTRILELHAEGVSRNDIARQLQRSPGVVSKVVAAAGKSFDRGGQVAAATQAKQQDNRARRAALESRFLDEANLLLDQLHQPHLVYNFGGRDNTYEEHQLSEPDVGAKGTLVSAASKAVTQAIRLAEVDSAAAGADEGRSIIAAFFAAVGEHTPETDQEAEL